VVYTDVSERKISAVMLSQYEDMCNDDEGQQAQSFKNLRWG